jgi:zinc transport system ATP-binding protein
MSQTKQKKEILSVTHLSKVFGEMLVVDDVSFSVEEGDMLAIIGPNGSGKSTLMKMVLGLLTPSQGTVTLHTARGIKDIGYVPQRFTFERSTPITVKEFLDLNGCKEHKHSDPKEVEKSLALVGAEYLKERQLGNLSGGQLQRVLVARALLHEKKILILDEPNTNIDVKGEKAMYELLKKLNEENHVTIIVISHELEFVSKYAKRVLCMNCSLVCSGKPSKALTKTMMQHLYACTDC